MTKHTIHVEDRVRLMKSIPELLLQRGDVGVVCSIWHTASLAYEVEFLSDESAFGTRTVVPEEHVEVEEHPAELDGPH